MFARMAWMTMVVAALGGCGSADDTTPADTADDASMTATADSLLAGEPGTSAACVPDPRMAVANRPSPYDSTTVSLNGSELKVCYGRPSMRGREIFGGLVPYDTVWRTGANEPTIMHVPVAASIAGIQVDPGSYSLYTVPGEDEWTVIVNRSTTQWGIESQYTDEIRAQEVGRAQLQPETTATPQEMFTITGRSTGAGSADLLLEWEGTRVTIPVIAS